MQISSNIAPLLGFHQEPLGNREQSLWKYWLKEGQRHWDNIVLRSFFFFFLNKTKKKSCQTQSHNNSDFESLTISSFSETKVQDFSRTQNNFSRTLVCIYQLPWNKAIYKIVEWQLILGKSPTCSWIIIFRKFSQILYSIILFDLSIKFHRTFCMKISKLLRVAEISFITNFMVF